ncbi:hypothetical protein SAMN05216323_11521 [Williamwhitmania taraxaci]|uniref:YARHG domain-containing protein n=2 Tax=Williamwhitmania taraxaci TaxID=1640674 RepID=A0A1G6U464_9BACT|nr:hypothetical protein SAMN05216323_11521 [Williamwhitmania taraxaci]
MCRVIIVLKFLLLSGICGVAQIQQSSVWIPACTPIPKEVVKIVKEETELELLLYKMKVNPVLKLRDIAEIDGASILFYRSPRMVLFNPPMDNGSYKMILDVRRWPEETSSALPKLSLQNFYLVTKKGNRFVNEESSFDQKGEPINWKEIPAYSDTLSFDLWSKDFPFDERYIVYYDSTENKVYPVGGAAMLYPIKNGWLSPYLTMLSFIAELNLKIRLDRFNLKQDSDGNKLLMLDGLEKFGALDSINPNSDKYIKSGKVVFYYYLVGCDLTEGLPAIVKTTAVNRYFNGEVELTYYKGHVVEDANSQDGYRYKFQEIRYFLRNIPREYGETLPIVRDLSDRELNELMKTPYERFLVFPYDEYSKKTEKEIPKE